MENKMMYLRKLIIGLILISTINVIQSQSYIGYLEDNYNGVHGIISNPANIADSRLKMDINLVGISALYGNDYIGFNIGDAFKDYSMVFDNAETFPSANNFLAFNIDVMGPSVMLSIDQKSSLAIFTRGRGVFNLVDANGNLLEKEGGFDENEDFNFIEDDIVGSFSAWGEIGATYARILLNDGQHFLKGGLTGKIIQGFGNVYIDGTGITVDYDSNTREVTTTGEIHLGDTGNIDENGNTGEALDINNGFGISGDLGLIYEWRPDHTDFTKMKSNGSTIVNRGVNKYKLKFGLSLTDFGKILNVKGTDRLYDLNRTQNIDNFDGDVLEEALLDNFNQISSEKSESYILPTALHTNMDWNLDSKFYVNLNADISLTTKSKINTGSILNQYRLTPRYESKWLAIYSPMSIIKNVGFQWGAGFRLGPIYMGSGSILSSLVSNNTKGLDLYAGAKIPLYHNKLRDKDNDGIINKEDNCPEIAGPIENQGCPWPDTDKDGVLDKDDDCPNEAGPMDNNGCPWSDSDGDGIFDKDDECPETPGLSEYEFGKIPKHASYKLRERMDDFIEVTIEWMDPDNNNYKIVYHARAYGKMKVNDSIEIAKDPIFELENYYTLEIHTYINHIKRNYSTRKIANYDVMGVIGQIEKANKK